jgi:hypothetical protein
MRTWRMGMTWWKPANAHQRPDAVETAKSRSGKTKQNKEACNQGIQTEVIGKAYNNHRLRRSFRCDRRKRESVGS